MLIRFTVENFLNFRDETEFIMFPGKGQQPERHVIKVENKDDIAVLKTAVIFGANASGKSNLIKAMVTARQMVLHLPMRDDTFEDQRFKFDKVYLNKPTTFEFEVKGDTYNYAYGFSYTPNAIQREWLYRVTKSGQQCIFEKESETGNYHIEKSFFSEFLDHYQRISMMAEDVLPNQLFLTSVNNRNIKDIAIALDLQEVFNWFLFLTVIFPKSRYLKHYMLPFEDEFSRKFKELIMTFDTGIDDVDLREIPKDEINQNISTKIYQDAIKSLHKKQIRIYSKENHNQYLLIKQDDNTLIVKEIVMHHLGGHKDCWLEMAEESDGTKRLADLLPVLINAALGKFTVFIIDEIDRSLHPHLTRFFMRTFLDVSANTQLIITSHDKGLLDQDIFRKDEVWYVEKNIMGFSHLKCLAEFKDIRKDLDIEKGYMDGRFGAIPMVGAVCEDKKEYHD